MGCKRPCRCHVFALAAGLLFIYNQKDPTCMAELRSSGLILGQTAVRGCLLEGEGVCKKPLKISEH